MARIRWCGVKVWLVHRRSTFALVALVATLAFAISCGGSSDEAGTTGDSYVQVVASDTIYTRANLEALGYKVSKTYDVEGLVDADEAYYGFWRGTANGAPTDYEVRFYSSHVEAVESGTAQAEEATGEDAVLDRTVATWTEGLSDRRRVVGPGASQGTGQPRYLDYVILGNLIALCEGRNLEDAQERCNDLVLALSLPGS